MAMLRLKRIFKNYEETGSLNELIPSAWNPR
jgi:hypothetical protein